MAENDAGEFVLDFTKLKIPELKAELASRGLKTSGKKSDLIDRLQTYLEEHEDVEHVDGGEDEEDALLLDETAEADALNESSKPQEEEKEAPAAAASEEPVADEAVMEAEETETPAAASNENTSEQAVEVSDEVTEQKPAEDADVMPVEEPSIDVDLLKTDDNDDVEVVDVTPAKPKKLMPRIEFPTDEKKEDKPKEEAAVQENGSSEKKKLTEAERLERRKARFGNLTTNGAPAAESKQEEKSKKGDEKTKPKMNKLSKEGADIDPDKLKKRAERFGSTVSSALVKSQTEEAIEKRKRRFGGASEENGTAAAATTTTTDSEAEAKKAKRAERFQSTTVAV